MGCGSGGTGRPRLKAVPSLLSCGPHASWSAFLNPYSLLNEVSSHCIRETQELTEATLAGTQWVYRLLREWTPMWTLMIMPAGAEPGLGARLASQTPGAGAVLCLKPSLSHGWARLGPTGTHTGSPKLP